MKEGAWDENFGRVNCGPLLTISLRLLFQRVSRCFCDLPIRRLKAIEMAAEDALSAFALQVAAKIVSCINMPYTYAVRSELRKQTLTMLTP